MWYPASHPSHRMSLGASSPSPQTSHAVVSASPIPSPPPRGAEVCSGGSDRGGIGARDRSEEGSEEAGSDESDESSLAFTIRKSESESSSPTPPSSSEGSDIGSSSVCIARSRVVGHRTRGGRRRTASGASRDVRPLPARRDEWGAKIDRRVPRFRFRCRLGSRETCFERSPGATPVRVARARGDACARACPPAAPPDARGRTARHSARPTPREDRGRVHGREGFLNPLDETMF